MDEEIVIQRCRAQADDLAQRAGTAWLKRRPWQSLSY